MIGKLTGTLLEKNPPEVLVDCAGVGYEVQVPMDTFYNLPAVGERVSLLTQFIVREDAQLLYGFATAPERAAFRQLIKISGVGPRMALGILSGMGVEDLAQAITLQEAGRLVKVPGIGKKNRRALVARIERQAGRGHRQRAAANQLGRAGRYFASAAGAGLQRQRCGGRAQSPARRCRRERWHQAGAQGAG